MRKLNYLNVINSGFDAGIYREYIVQNFSGVLEFGGLAETYYRARQHCRKLGKNNWTHNG